MVTRRQVDLLDKIFNNSFNFTTLTTDGVSEDEIYTTEDATVLEIDIPGVQKKDVSIKLDGLSLSISWSRTRSNSKPVTRTRNYNFKSTPVEEISAELKDGVLQVKIPHSKIAAKQTEVLIK